jgi:hypothetical protein
MKNRLTGSIFCVAVLAFSTAVLAQQPGAAGAKPIPRTPDGKPDLSGIWKTASSKADPIQLTALGTARYNYNKLPKGDGARAELDPVMHCYRPGLARIGPPLQVPASSIRVRIDGESVPFPGGPAGFDVIDIRYALHKVWVLYQYNSEVRQIFTDGRKHPEVSDDDLLTKWWNGHSTGTWNGDTFVVDTLALRDEVWVDNFGHEQSSEMHMVERFRRLDADTLEIERIITDPKMLAKPQTTRTTLKLRQDATFLENMVCDQYYVRKVGFGFGGLLGINDHPWQSAEENPNATWQDVEREEQEEYEKPEQPQGGNQK